MQRTPASSAVAPSNIQKVSLMSFSVLPAQRAHPGFEFQALHNLTFWRYFLSSNSVKSDDLPATTSELPSICVRENV
jgi:hypothetical protein